MKAILMSIQPKHLVNILNGKKTLEIRKSIPKGFVGWVYIYCTKGKPYITETCNNYNNLYMFETFNIPHFGDIDLNGKVVARFWFDEYIAYKYYEDDNSYFAKRPQDFGYHADEVLKRLCLSRDEFKTYGKGKDLYAWRIKKLEIFDRPKKLNEFCRYLYQGYTGIGVLETYHKLEDLEEDIRQNLISLHMDKYKITKAPQTYCYIEVIE